MYAKVNSHRTNANYVQNNVNTHAHTILATGGIVELKTSNKHLDSWGQVPETKTINVPIIIPYYLGGVFNIFHATLGYCPIKNTTTSLPGSTNKNNIKWDYSHSPGRTDYKTSPNLEDGWMTGTSKMTYLWNENNPITVTGVGMVRYKYLTGTDHFTYSYNTAVQSTQANIDVEPSGL